jgi:hypothetical protein
MEHGEWRIKNFWNFPFPISHFPLFDKAKSMTQEQRWTCIVLGLEGKIAIVTGGREDSGQQELRDEVSCPQKFQLGVPVW